MEPALEDVWDNYNLKVPLVCWNGHEHNDTPFAEDFPRGDTWLR